jgi:hypothetical protein
MLGDIPDRIPEDILNRMPEGMTNKIPDKISNKILENMSNKIPKYLLNKSRNITTPIPPLYILVLIHSMPVAMRPKYQ